MGLFALTVYAGCAGDCMTCHPKLKGSKDHVALTTCIKCHTPTNKKLFEFGSSSEGCGDNCFDCHKQWPKDGNHAPMLKCESCHKKYKK
ncbi:MAG: cytochrome c3 family protein [Deferribacterales bacterium]